MKKGVSHYKPCCLIGPVPRCYLILVQCLAIPSLAPAAARGGLKAMGCAGRGKSPPEAVHDGRPYLEPRPPFVGLPTGGWTIHAICRPLPQLPSASSLRPGEAEAEAIAANRALALAGARLGLARQPQAEPIRQSSRIVLRRKPSPGGSRGNSPRGVGQGMLLFCVAASRHPRQPATRRRRAPLLEQLLECSGGPRLEMSTPVDFGYWSYCKHLFNGCFLWVAAAQIQCVQ
jgi:hypothetical protein